MATIGELKKVEDFVIEWKIRNFFSLTEKVDKCYYSPVFSFAEETWYLQIFPNGENGSSEEYIDLYLGRKSPGPAISLDFFFGLKTSDERIREDIYEDSHCEYIYTEAGAYGIYMFLLISELTEKRCELVPSGILSVVCRIKYPKVTELQSLANTVITRCEYCKINLEAHKDLASHQEKCMDRPIKCPDCSDVIALKNWYDHKCQISEAKVHPKNKILEDFKQLFYNQENCDVTLRVNELEFSAHKAILSARSPVFASTFRNDMKEKKTGIVDIKDCDPSSFSDFLCFLYCEEMESLSEKSVFNLFATADRYDVTDLRGMCLEFMKENLSVRTFCKTLTIAFQHTESELIRISTNFFVDNAEEILETVEWQRFTIENPIQSNELFIKYVKSVKHATKCHNS